MRFQGFWVLGFRVQGPLPRATIIHLTPLLGFLRYSYSFDTYGNCRAVPGRVSKASTSVLGGCI